MDLESFSLSNVDLLQQLATLEWIHNGDPAMLEKITAARVGYELYERVSGHREIEALKTQTILAIAKYIKDHPKASKEELTTEIVNQIKNFAQKVEKM
ncbi:hypothetical protein ACJMK2_036776 [Sinanodonta woodiana]|uniref:Uncharacterized protein n=1 Tax=Sinanodonta woodiana TaxID=1069815 RepID=A0ABD3WI96_SINWO